MNQNVHDLLNLIAQNPDLPIIPTVASEGIIGDDRCTSWLASWGAARVDHILLADERYYIKSEDDREEILEEFMGSDAFAALPEDENMDALLDALPWKKAILVKINPPTE